MRWPGILFLAWVTVIALHCGGRTPFGDIEPEGSSTSTGTSMDTGSSSTAAGSSATTTGGLPTTGAGGATSGAGGATSGSGGANTGVGSTGATTTTTGGITTGAGGAGGPGGVGGGGLGGAPGAGGRGAGGRGAGGAGNPLLGIIPGITPTQGCTNCVNMRCNGTQACSSDPACLAGVSCYVDNCAMIGNGNAQGACATRCFQGNAMVERAAVQAVTCIFAACGGPCQAGGRGGLM